MDILIQQALVDGKKCDVLIQNGRFSQIEARIAEETLSGPVHRLDAANQALLPSFANTHGHTAMVLLRGLGDDMPLHQWLTEVIWPIENRLTGEQIYWGTLYGCYEMIRSGITAVLDMYWQLPQGMRAFYQSGLRAFVCAPNIAMEAESPARMLARMEEELALAQSYPARITYAAGIHAVYTTTPEIRRLTADFAETHDLLLTAHLSETQKENDDCLAQTGKTPTALFAGEGLLSRRFIGAHGIWLAPEDRRLLTESGAAVAHCPNSNCKLASGIFDEAAARRDGLRFGLGTDGASSNNRYDMFSEMHTAALLHKIHTTDPATATAPDIYQTATRDGFDMLGLDAGRIAIGKAADCILVDLDYTGLVPNFNLVSNLVYAATPECIQTTICDGRILMHNRKIQGEEEVREAFRACTASLR